MTSRTIPKLVVRTVAGSDGAVEIEDCSEAVGDWPEIGEVCELSPNGRCEYSWVDHWRCCIHCKQESGL